MVGECKIPNAHVRLCWDLHKMALNQMAEFKLLADQNFQWVREVLEEAKKTMATPDLQLLPKTPGQKRSRRAARKRNSKLSIAKEEDHSGGSNKSTRATRASNRNATKGSSGRCGKRSVDSPTTEQAVCMSLSAVAMAAASPRLSPANRLPNSPSRPIPGFHDLSVKAKAQAFQHHTSGLSAVARTQGASSPHHKPRSLGPQGSPEQPDVKKVRRSTRSGDRTPPSQTDPTSPDEVGGEPAVCEVIQEEEPEHCVRGSERRSTRLSSRMSVSRRRSSMVLAAAKALLLNKHRPHLTSDLEELPVQKTRSRLKVNKVLIATPDKRGVTGVNTPTMSRVTAADDATAAARRTTRSMIRTQTPQKTPRAQRAPVDMSDGRAGGKRGTPSEALDESLPKRRKPNSNTSPHASGPASRVTKPLRVPIPAASFLNNQKKLCNQGTPTQQQSSNAFSFIPRVSPKKTSSREETMEQKRRELEAKEKKAENLLQLRNQQLQDRAEEQRRRREERQQLAAQRRQQQLSKERENMRDMTQRLEARKNKEALLEEKQQVELEKKKLREKKLLQASELRKQEEEARTMKQQEMEKEQRKQEAALAVKREQEEQERQRRLAEQLKVAEERQAQAERERQAEAARLRRLEEEQRRQEQARRKEKEERERKERAERERQELERIKERERLRPKEAEPGADKREEEIVCVAQVPAALPTHQAPITNNKPVTTSQPHPAMNRTFEKDSSADNNNCETYDITPVRKVYKAGTAENYDITDLHSDDSTDDETQPRKRIPDWAVGNKFKIQIINQHYHPPDLDAIFDEIEPLDLSKLFSKYKPRFHKRTSSQFWTTPMYKPSGAPMDS